MAVRDPVRDLVAVAFAAGVERGRHAPALVRRVADCLRGVVLGVLLTLWWSGAFGQVPAAAEQYRRDLLRAAQGVWGMDAPVSLLAAQLHAESGWRPDAVSPVGALGLAQFMRATAADVARRYGGGPPNPLDPRWAMTAQSRYLRELHEAISGAANASERMAFALAGYNGGARWVQRRRALSATPGRCLGAACDVNPGVSEASQRENRAYPRRILLELMPRYYAAGWGGPALHARYTGVDR
jgi:soluble lytic murein transglycosylase-like protein